MLLEFSVADPDRESVAPHDADVEDGTLTVPPELETRAPLTLADDVVVGMPVWPF